MTKTILVAGGAGFIGSNLCERLLETGYSVWCLDNLSSGRKENLPNMGPNKEVHFVEHDVISPLGSLKLPKFDEIYNLACPASPPFYQSDPLQTLKTSFLGTMHLLDLAKDHGARLLQASTSEVYGDPLVHPQQEDYWGNVNPFGVRSCYDEGKRAAETLCFDYHRQQGVDARVVRIFNTYGPNMDSQDGRVVSNFINQAIRGNPITIYGDGSQTRSFCFVSDMVEGLIRAMETDNLPLAPINLGNPGEFTVRELAEKVIALTGSRSSLEHNPLPKDDPQRRKPDISRAKTLLGWEPTIPLGEGLKKTVAYYQSISLLEAI